jgi:hypothetical protein
MREFAMLASGIAGVGRRRSGNDAGRVALLAPLALLATVAVVVAGCGGSSKPAYCSDLSTLKDDVKGVSVPTSSSDVSDLKSQFKTIQSDATTLVNSAKSDFPSETSAIKSSVDTLATAVKALPSSPSTTQIAAIVSDAAGVASSVNSFSDAASSKCS